MSNEMGGLYVIDTHVLIWYFLGSPRLKGNSRSGSMTRGIGTAVSSCRRSCSPRDSMWRRRAG